MITRLRLHLVWLWLFALAGQCALLADEVAPTLEIQSQGHEASFDETTGLMVITNGVKVTYKEGASLTILTSDEATINQRTGDVYARGHVRIRHDEEVWKSEQVHYNFITKEMNAESFRFGENYFYIAGRGLQGVGEGTNGIYHGTNAIATTDDYGEPLQRVRARSFTIVPGKYVEAHDATFWVGGVPVFYFPYYRHSLEKNPNHFSFLPGYRSIFGPYLLTSYDWFWDEHLHGALHADYREARGFGLGPDVDYDYGPWGEGSFKYYYARDHKPGTNLITGAPISRDRDRVYFSYDAHPDTNLTILSQVAWQRDDYIVRDFFESQYRRDIQPATYVDANKSWPNWSLDALAQPRVNPYWDTVERLPDVRLTGFKQQVLDLPVYYDSQSSVGYFRRRYGDTNTASPGDFSASRVDTFHQLTAPQTFFGWLTITPRAGGRFTYYDAATGQGATTTNQSRGVFNTGAEASLTVSRLWADSKNSFWDVDGIRHIFQPSVEYVYVPQPNVLPDKLPQFDYELTNNLRLLPLDYPEYNSIDSINSQNTIRYGLNNRLQTKRSGEVDDLVNWGVYMDWNLRPRSDQSTFSDIYSDLALKPEKWITISSYTRYSIAQGQFNLAQHALTLQPNNTWNWSLGHIYLRSGELFGTGDNLFSSVYFYRFNENWGTRVAHYFDAGNHRLQEQDYSIYRDLRSWTAALTFRALSNVGQATDYGVAFTFSFKSFPRFGLGQDTVTAAPLLGN